MKLKKLERMVYAFDEEYNDLGKINIVMAKDLKRCNTCGWMQPIEFHDPYTRERGVMGHYCGCHDCECNLDDFCAWWDRYGGE